MQTGQQFRPPVLHVLLARTASRQQRTEVFVRPHTVSASGRCCLRHARCSFGFHSSYFCRIFYPQNPRTAGNKSLLFRIISLVIDCTSASLVLNAAARRWCSVAETPPYFAKKSLLASLKILGLGLGPEPRLTGMLTRTNFRIQGQGHCFLTDFSRTFADSMYHRPMI